jgi:sirohydrochlorin ferrochelatase
MHISSIQDTSEAGLPKTALLLIAHGSREANANRDLYELVHQLRKQGRYAIVEASFLELVEPAIDQAAAHCVAQGAERVILLPYFLSAGVHVTRDLGQAQQKLTACYPQVEFCLAGPLGLHPLLLQVVLERARQAVKKG